MGNFGGLTETGQNTAIFLLTLHNERLERKTCQNRAPLN